jgi:Ca2+-binding RTX toxin-like protein
MPVYYGTSVNDTMYGSTGDDEFFAYEGNDRIYGSVGLDTVWGSTGEDIIDYGNATAVRFDLSRSIIFNPTDGEGSYDFVFGVEHVNGSAFNGH